MKVLVTGSSGMIGAALVDALRVRGHEVVEVDVREGRDAFAVELADWMRGCDGVVHLAGISYPRAGMRWDEYWRLNCVLTEHVAAAAEALGVRRLVFASSTTYYGAERGFEPAFSETAPAHEGSANAVQTYRGVTLPLMDDDHQAAIFYMVAKVIAEAILAAFGLTRRLQVTILRLCPTSPQGAPYEWGLRLTLEHAVGAIVAALEDEREDWYDTFNVAEEDVAAMDTSKWAARFGGTGAGQ